MNNQEEKTQSSLEVALVDEVTGNHLKDLFAEGAEITLDSFLEDGILKEIPFFGVFYKGFKAAFGIRESIFAKKIYRFLTELKDIPHEQRLRFIQQLEDQKEFRQKVGEKLLVLIEQLDDLEKPQIIGRLLKAAITEKISYEEFLRVSSIVQRAFLPDLRKISNYPRTEGLNQIVREHFEALGIMTIELKENRRDAYISEIASIGGDKNKQPLPKLSFKLNSVGRMLVEYGLKDPPGT